MVCEKFATCKFLRLIEECDQSVKRGWIIQYCSDAASSVRCERLRFIKQRGEKPPENMTPTGDTLKLNNTCGGEE